MKQDKMYNYLNLSNGSSAMPAINFGIMTSLNNAYPSVAEQQKIGTYFATLDNLITLHQRNHLTPDFLLIRGCNIFLQQAYNSCRNN